MYSARGIYSRLQSDGFNSSEDSDKEKLLSEGNEAIIPGNTKNGLSYLIPRVSVNATGCICLLIFNVVMAALLVHLHEAGAWSSGSQDDSAFAYSPVSNHIDLPFSRKKVDARLFPAYDDPTAIYIGKPSKQVDDAWNRIGDNMMLGITKDDVTRVGKDPNIAVKFNPAWGLGEELYLAEVDVFHQIHCLNTLRKSLVFNYGYYFYDLYGYDPPQFFESHARHCVSILLQTIQCHSDLEVVTHVWAEGTPQPYPDFGVNKQCRDFDALLEWKEKHDLQNAHEKFRSYRPPKGVTYVSGEATEEEVLGNATGFAHGSPTKHMSIKGCNV